MKRLRFYIHTLGCPKNEVDSNVISSILSKRGFEEVKDYTKADIILINSCGFIQSAKEETINTVFDYVRSKSRGQKIAVLGCLAQRYKDKLPDLIPEVDGFVGADAYSRISEIVDSIVKGESRNRYWGKSNSCSFLYKERDRDTGPVNKSYTFVKIADGCSNRCSFCAIPTIKGRYVSRRLSDVVREIEGLVEAGYREIGLVSQDITAYGLDLGYRDYLYRLLLHLEKIKGDFWIRLYYLYPRRIDERILRLIGESKRIVHYLDIPIQHISDDILRRMRRGHNSAFIERLIDKIREVIPDVVIRSAFIVGFPSEKRRDINLLKVFLKRYRLDNVGFFKYSDEEGTDAFRMTNKVTPRTIDRRYREMYEVQERISYELNQSKIGRIYKVLIDYEDEEYYAGRYYGQAPEIDGVVYIKKPRRRLKGFVECRIYKADSYDLYGTVEEGY